MYRKTLDTWRQIMKIKRCAVCKKPAFSNTIKVKQESNWVCSTCLRKFEEQVVSGIVPTTGELCRKCKNTNCRFSASERRKITDCTDWIGKDTEHNRKRWAKFERD